MAADRPGQHAVASGTHAPRGWPGRTLVGEDGAQAAWLLAQHADHNPDLQRAFLDALRDAVARGELPRRTSPIWRTRCASMPGSLSSMTPSSPSRKEKSGPIRSRTHSDSTSGARIVVFCAQSSRQGLPDPCTDRRESDFSQ
jgi:hypothetical protein